MKWITYAGCGGDPCSIEANGDDDELEAVSLGHLSYLD